MLKLPKLTRKLVILLSLCCLAGSLITLPNQINAQVNQLSKTPHFSWSKEQFQNIDPIVMPDNYPNDLLEKFDQELEARSYAVIDEETHHILAQKEGNIPYPIASMSKVISTYLVFKAIKEGRLSMDEEIQAPEEITSVLSDDPELSSTGLVGGVSYSVKDLLHGVIMKSGNDATSVLMWHIYGSEQEGTQAIIDQLKEWGMRDFAFYTVSGLPNSLVPESWRLPGSDKTNENVMSAQDVALMAQYTVEEFPEILEISQKQQYVFKEGTDYEQIFYTTNKLLPGQEYGREGITGLKSGSTDAAGLNFVATGQENGRKIIAVSMGNMMREDGSFSSPYQEIYTLLDALAQYPDLYKNDQLPSNKHLSLADQEALEASIQGSLDQANPNKANKEKSTNNYTNHRDNAITNFFKKIFPF